MLTRKPAPTAFGRALRIAAASLLIFILAGTIGVLAQAPITYNTTTQLWVGAPSGNCAGQQQAQNTSTGDFYVCNGGLTSANGTWQKMVTQPITTGAGFFGFGQGAAQGHTTANMAIYEGAAAVTAHEVKLPGTANSGVRVDINSSAVVTEDFSGNTTYSTASGGVTIGSGTSIGSTSLCATTACPAGSYLVVANITITTACTTTGTYQINLIYTDPTTVSKTVVLPLTGLGTTTASGGPTATTSSLALASTTNYAQGVFTLRSSGAASINYSTTAGACGTGGPMVGKMSLHVIPMGP